ncbi:MAG: 30S ribosomal protein S12 methylthiotransferase RimO [Bacteroidales bacterium]|nr:30S ribosomal protein S12 methylthiotransferase RimO [Bacteroidales bacterium]MCF8405045.1 30S ribosomal protein S12 methylthiotransferase RimO [Bacteroidales bacterium]
MKTQNTKKRINLVSLGCSKNLVDSEVLMSQLKANNFNINFEKDALGSDAVIINTCGFINDAKQESIDTILQHIEAKERGDIGQVYVMGCLSERYINDLKTEIPDVDKYFGVNDIQQIVKELGGDYKKDLIGERSITTPSHYAYLKISEGCDRRCTFCAIPSIRGKHVSKPVEEIIVEAKRLVAKGVKEVMLIAQDLTYYGIDLYKKNTFASMLNSLAGIKGLEWIRLHYAYPAGFPEDLLPLMQARENICNYIDIPVQHINNRILSLMQRGHTKEGTIDLLKKIRKHLPDAAIRSTLIVGFPGETDEEFKELVDFVKEFKFNRLGVFTYSHEEGTTAYKLKDTVTEKVKKQRLDEIMEVQQEISLEYNSKLVGKTIKTIIDRKEGDYFIGRTEFDSPEVDNEVIINSPHSDIEIGRFYQVKIEKADFFDLYGMIKKT